MITQTVLLDIPRESRILEPCSDGSKYLTFCHIDGLYSYCKTEKGGIAHLSATTPLEKVEGGYKIVN